MSEGIMARCWAFALDRQNSALIQRLAHIHASRLGLGVEDFAQELRMAVAFSYPRFRPEKGSAKTWIRWQARALVKTIRRERSKTDDIEIVIGCDPEGDEVRLLDQARDEIAHERIDKAAQLAQVLRHASDAQLEACELVVLGLTDSELREQYGRSRQARNHHLKKLRAAAS
jgi:RNA polymerase sigma factor (sigma-70 family)